MAEFHSRLRPPVPLTDTDMASTQADSGTPAGVRAVPGLLDGPDLVPLRRATVIAMDGQASHGADRREQALRRHLADAPGPSGASTPPPLPAPLRRLVTIGGTPYPAKKKLPNKPKGTVPQKLLPDVTALATTWQGDEVDHTYTTAEAFYQALVAAVLSKGDGKASKQAEGKKERRPKGKAPWPTIIHASTVEGRVQAVDWSSFDTDAADALLTELLEATVQLSSNTETTACHGNSHRKLPKPVDEARPEPLASIPKYQQPDHTDYIELLVRGHKKESGIERGIIDRRDGGVYLTAHYDKGSFVELVNAPRSLIADWQAKAEEYCRLLKSFAPKPE